MSILDKKQQVLAVLAENLNNPQPQVVDSEIIADKLQMSMKDICHLLKIMHEMGAVVSDLEGQHALITQQGLNSMTL